MGVPLKSAHINFRRGRQWTRKIYLLCSPLVYRSKWLILFPRAFFPERLQGNWLFSGYLDPNGEVSWQFIKMTLHLMRITRVKLTLITLLQKICLSLLLFPHLLEWGFSGAPQRWLKMCWIHVEPEDSTDTKVQGENLHRACLTRLCLMQQNKNLLRKEKLIKCQREGKLYKQTQGQTNRTQSRASNFDYREFFFKNRELHLKHFSPLSHTVR